MPPARGKKRSRGSAMTTEATPAPKRQQRTAKKNSPRPLTTDDIPVLVEEVVRNLSRQTGDDTASHEERRSDEERREGSHHDGRRHTRQSNSKSSNERTQQDDTQENTSTRQSRSGSQSSDRRRSDPNDKTGDNDDDEVQTGELPCLSSPTSQTAAVASN